MGGGWKQECDDLRPYAVIRRGAHGAAHTVRFSVCACTIM